MKINKDDPRSINYACPACYSDVGEKCTTPTNESRRSVPWFHFSRANLVPDE